MHHGKPVVLFCLYEQTPEHLLLTFIHVENVVTLYDMIYSC